MPIPNRHDGENFSLIMAHEHGSEIFAAWVLILQVASRCQPRGSLVRDNKKPHTPATLSIKTRAPENWFKLALDFLEKETDWLEIDTNCHLADSKLPDACQSPDEEGKGRKGIELNEIDREKGIALEVELPSGFPRTEAEAKAVVGTVGCTEEFAVETWNKAMGRHGRDAKDVPIRSWPHYLKSESNFKANRDARDKANPSGFRNGKSQLKPDHSKGF